MVETAPTADDSFSSDRSTSCLHQLLLRPALQTHAYSTNPRPFQVEGNWFSGGIFFSDIGFLFAATKINDALLKIS